MQRNSLAILNILIKNDAASHKDFLSFHRGMGGARQDFIEVSGLNIATDVTEFRDGADPTQAVHKVPGHTHYSNIILKDE